MSMNAEALAGATETARPRSFARIGAVSLRLPLAARIVMLALCFRVAGATLGFISNVTIPDYQNQGFTVFEQPHPFWDRFARWDSGWYNDIASGGYRFVEGGRSNLAFFPLYPQLMGTFGRALGGAHQDFYLAGIAISWMSFGIAMVLLYRLARFDFAHAAALRATMYAAIFPSAYFFGVVYSESLFLLTLVGAALALRAQHWLLAAVAMAAMTATRVNGVMFLPALAWIGWRAAGPAASMRWRPVAAAAAGMIGIGSYSVFNYAISGNPFEWYDSITRWGYHPGGNPLTGIYTIAHALVTGPVAFITAEKMAPYDAINAITAAATLATVPFIWKRLGGPYAAVVILGLLLPLSSGQYEGLGRYCSVLFPLPIVLGSMHGEARHLGLITCFALFYALGLILFGNVHPLF
jgi:Mannosyltransferase (PIG-V)